MPVYLTDGRKGLTLIPKEYEGSFMMHYGVKGQKWGNRRWQNEDGSLTPEGYIHYGVGKRRTKGLVGTPTNGEGTFERSAYKTAADPKIRKQLLDILAKSSNPDVDLGCDVADMYTESEKNLNDAFLKYSKKMYEDTGKPWDGDGTEEHWALEKRYPEYKKISKQRDQALKDLVDVSNTLAKSKDFKNVKGFEKTLYFYDSFPEYGDWYKKGDQRAFAICQAMLTRNNKQSDYYISEVFPEYFIDSYLSDGTKLKSVYFD